MARNASFGMMHGDVVSGEWRVVSNGKEVSSGKEGSGCWTGPTQAFWLPTATFYHRLAPTAAPTAHLAPAAAYLRLRSRRAAVLPVVLADRACD